MMNTEWDRLDSRFSCVLAMRRFFCPAQTPQIPKNPAASPPFPPPPASGCEDIGKGWEWGGPKCPEKLWMLHPKDGADPAEFPRSWITFKVLGCGISPELIPRFLPLQKTSKASSVDLTSTSVQPITYMLWFWSSRRILDWGGLWDGGKEGK